MLFLTLFADIAQFGFGWEVSFELDTLEEIIWTRNRVMWWLLAHRSLVKFFQYIDLKLRF